MRIATRVAVLLVGLSIAAAQLSYREIVTSSVALSLSTQPNQQSGINFVSAPGTSFSNQIQRYAQASQAAAAWNRWPLYWSQVENLCNGNPNWSQTDGVVAGDTSHGLTVDAILLGT